MQYLPHVLADESSCYVSELVITHCSSLREGLFMKEQYAVMCRDVDTVKYHLFIAVRK